MDSPTNGIGKFGDRGFCLFDIGVRLFVPRDGKCEREISRLLNRLVAFRRRTRRTRLRGSRRAWMQYSRPIVSRAVSDRSGQDGRAMWASCHADGFPMRRLALGDVEHDFASAVIWPQAFADVDSSLG